MIQIHLSESADAAIPEIAEALLIVLLLRGKSLETEENEFDTLKKMESKNRQSTAVIWPIGDGTQKTRQTGGQEEETIEIIQTEQKLVGDIQNRGEIRTIMTNNVGTMIDHLDVVTMIEELREEK
mmetsp:Transcript_29697/g.47625  ORF Transcript_29697/g.47625 Transcript_29697/m.47625 type:complete len:125 (-) Transcript_29697:467-841(-)